MWTARGRGLHDVWLKTMTDDWHLDATGENTVDTDTYSTNHTTSTFTPQLAPTDGVRVDGRLRVMHGPEVVPQNGEDVHDTSAPGMSENLPRGPASESSALVATIGGSRATLDMQMVGDRDRELTSFIPSSSILDLTVVAASADAPLHHAVIQSSSRTS